jgi:hypothetical protein
MEHVLDIVIEEGKGTQKGKIITLGIRVYLGDHETFCPISGPIGSLDEWEAAVQRILEGIERISHRGRALLEPPKEEMGLDLLGDLDPEELWSRLSQIEEEDHFIRSFNELEPSRRRDVAEYVLTTCNIFSGNAAIFSSRYDDESGLLV